MGLTVLETEREMPGRGPEGQKGHTLVIGREGMDEHKFAEMKW